MGGAVPGGGRGRPLQVAAVPGSRSAARLPPLCERVQAWASASRSASAWSAAQLPAASTATGDAVGSTPR